MIGIFAGCVIDDALQQEPTQVLLALIPNDIAPYGSAITINKAIKMEDYRFPRYTSAVKFYYGTIFHTEPILNQPSS